MLKVNEDEIVPQIKLFNWMDLVFQKSSTLKANFDLNFNQLNLNQWESLLLKEGSENIDSSNSMLKYNIQGAISGEKILYDKITCKDVKIKKIKINNSLIVNGMSFQAHSGEYKLIFLMKALKKQMEYRRENFACKTQRSIL